MKPYVIIQSKRYLCVLVELVLVYIFYMNIVISMDHTPRRGLSGVVLFPIYIIYVLFKYCRSLRYDNHVEILNINQRWITIHGKGKTSVNLEWKKIVKIEILNGLTTKFIFHYKYEKHEVQLYSYQRTFKLLKALKYFGSTTEIVERKKIFKILYVPFW